jgi:uncharacterized membrane protein
MDDLIRTGMVLILALLAAMALFLCGIAWLILRELEALAAGDTGFLLASIGSVLLVCAVYTGTGLWLKKTGRI